MAAAHQRRRWLVAIRTASRRHTMMVNGRRVRPISAIPLANKVRMRKGLPAGDVAAVATDLLVTAALLERRLRDQLRESEVNDLDVARLLLVLGSHHALLRP